MKQLSRGKALLLFYSFDIILLVVLALSFLPFAKKEKGPQSQQSALLNPKYAQTVSKIVVSTPEHGIRSFVTLTKQSGIWTGTDSDSNDMFLWPADSKTVQNLIDYAIKVQSMYKKSDSARTWKSFALDEKNARSISFYGSEGEIFSSLYFGTMDPITRRTPFRTWEEQTVWDADSGIELYLSSDPSFWADPLIIPECLGTYTAKDETSVELRRGKLLAISPGESNKPQEVVKVRSDSGRTAALAVYPKNDEFVIIPVFAADPSDSEKMKKLLSSFNYRYSVSAWTCAKILELR